MLARGPAQTHHRFFCYSKCLKNELAQLKGLSGGRRERAMDCDCPQGWYLLGVARSFWRAIVRTERSRTLYVWKGTRDGLWHCHLNTVFPHHPAQDLIVESSTALVFPKWPLVQTNDGYCRKQKSKETVPKEPPFISWPNFWGRRKHIILKGSSWCVCVCGVWAHPPPHTPQASIHWWHGYLLLPCLFQE